MTMTISGTNGFTFPDASQLNSSSQVVKAWVKFGAVAGVPGINASYNVGSITDNGVGDYTLNFVAPMIDTNYCFTLSVSNNAGNGAGFLQDQNNVPTASSLRVLSYNNTPALSDSTLLCVAVFR